VYLIVVQLYGTTAELRRIHGGINADMTIPVRNYRGYDGGFTEIIDSNIMVLAASLGSVRSHCGVSDATTVLPTIL